MSDPTSSRLVREMGMVPDLHTERGANACAHKVREYWRRRGYAVNVWTEPQCFVPRMRAAWYAVRSDLINGLPRNYKG